MKKYLFLALIVSSIVSCKHEHHHDIPKLETLKFTATQSDNGFNGALELYPCTENTTNYIGNYHNYNVSTINPSCVIKNGGITNWGYQLFLPLDTYNIIYWGISNAPVYSPARAKVPGLRLGDDLATRYWSLVLNKDKITYMPVWDQVMAAQNVKIGASGTNIELSRKVAGLNVTLKHSSGSTFDTAITGFEVLVGGIAEKINVATGAPENQTKTVKFNLTIDPTRTVANNQMVMLYPSSESPDITINILLANGQAKSYSTNIKNAFQANIVQHVTILTSDILSSDESSTFTVDNWDESSQTIIAPSI